MKLSRLLVLYFCIQFCITGCKKSEFLSVKPDQKISEPKTLMQLQSILDNDLIMNGGLGLRDGGNDPSRLLIGGDDYYNSSEFILGLSNPAFRALYTWQDAVFTDGRDGEWNNTYRSIFYANVVLAGLNGLSHNALETESYNNAKGSALFFRSRYFYNLAQIYAQPFNKNEANGGPGCILRLTPDINEALNRSTVAETYDQIIKDLKVAVSLLPIGVSYSTRPSKPAAYAMLAKTYLIMQDYEKANLYADSCLQLKSSLLDFNSVTAGFGWTNPEIIFHCNLSTGNGILIRPQLAKITSLLYNSYNNNDLRKTLYFSNQPNGEVFFKGSYDGSDWYFSGIAVDEILLIRAETNARINRVEESMNDLNKLMAKRWKNNGSFVPFTAVHSVDALQLILTERRKELVQRGTRWSDLRRLNLEGANIVLRRELGGQTYLLNPNDKRYTYLIPQDVMSFNSKLVQNPR